MARTRLKGQKITFSIGGTDYTLDASSVLFTQEEADNDVETFADAAAGGSFVWKCQITALQSLEAASLHNFMWTNSGSTAAFVFAPAGNTTPSVTQPHFTGNLKLTGKRPDIGGEASSAGSTWTFDAEFDVDGDITRKTA